jgi:hypothetical protein
VRLAAELIQAVDLGMIDSEIAEEFAHRPAVVTSGIRTKCDAEGIDRTLEDLSQRMLQWKTAHAVHEEILGRGRMHCATARAYCR